MSFDLMTFVVGCIGCLVIGCYLGNRHRSNDDVEAWRRGYAAGFTNGCLIGPPRFIGEDEPDTGTSKQGPAKR